MVNNISTGLAVAVLVTLTSIWFTLVNDVVTEPYLDEYFHVGQAQKYIAGKYFDWDPKITTPPGLYVISLVLSKLSGVDSIDILRATNLLLLPVLLLLVVDLSTKPSHSRPSKDDHGQPSSAVIYQLHSAFNICLFPPLFFFSALYYTDIASTVSVLVCWSHTIHHHRNGQSGALHDIVTILLGLLSLSFRQTNIFWVSIFPAAILFVSELDASIQEDQEEGRLYDPPVKESSIEDYCYFVVSLIKKAFRGVVVTLSGKADYLGLVRILVPYIVILICFGAFVVWNGGVVLGDKSNHVATIHLAQLLYLWPYIVFFSIPLVLPYLLQGLVELPGMKPLLSQVVLSDIWRGQTVTPRLVVIIGFLTIALSIVHFNTIVHPFTLADNRHYTFYVFRILRRHYAIKYMAAPIYLATAWSSIQSLGGLDATPSDRTKASPEDGRLKVNDAASGEGSTVSYVLIWLGTSALQLATAPLVEPRYFILPWLFWRMQVPCLQSSPKPDDRKTKTRKAPSLGFFVTIKRSLWDEHDRKLWLETIWFLIINFVTCYAFLYKGFVWPQEPGKVQRFMW